MKKLWCTGVLLVWILGLSVAAWAEVPQVFLVQNSGWMEPFYVDSKSEFRPLVQAVIQTLAVPKGEVMVAEFNQSIQTHKSPKLWYQGDNLNQAVQAVKEIGLVRKPGSTAFVDTDFQEAIVTSVTEFCKGRSALIWLFTNNKNSPFNDQNTIEKNKEFYNLIHDEPAIKRVIAYPLKMPLVGQKFKANGLMIYALAYGDAADAELERLLNEGVISKVLTEQPALLKPLDKRSVSFLPGEVEKTGSIRLYLGQDQKTLIMEADASTKAAEVRIHGSFRNEFYPYTINRGVITAHLVGDGFNLPLAVEPGELTNLEPGQQQPVTVGVPIAGAQLPSVWSLKALSLMGTEYTTMGKIELALEQQELKVSKTFMDLMTNLFPGDPLPEVFQPGKEANASAVSLPVEMRVKYPLYPLIIVGVIALLALATVVVLFATLMRPATYMVLIEGGERRAVSMRCLTSTTLELKDRWGKLQHIKVRRGFGQPKTVEAPSGFQVMVE